MEPRDWLLVLIGLDGTGVGLDPIRLQKGMFLLAREGGLPPVERYWFVPYNYGPMSPRLYRDVEALVRLGLVERRVAPGHRWGLVAATAAGRLRASRLVGEAPAETRESVARLRAIRTRIEGLTFAELLAWIYDRYPGFASRSVFRRR